MENLAKMPKWVQVTTWFILLILTCYFYLTPRFVNGHAIVRLENGGTIDYRGATIRTHVEGRVLKFKSNEDGYWSVPVVSRLPQDMRLEIYHEDKQAWFAAMIESGTIWKSAFGAAEVRLVVDGGDKPVMLEVVERSGTGAAIQLVDAVLSVLGSPAYAQERLSREQVARRTAELVAQILRKKPAEVTTEFRLLGGNAPTYRQKLQIIQAVESEFKVRVPDEAWRQMATLGDLVEYVFTNQR
jgi:hypothetical protein